MPQGRDRPTHADCVLEFLRRRRRPLSAYEIPEALRRDVVAAAVAVYWVPAKLLEAGRVQRIESSYAWTARCEPHHSGAPAFEICDGRGIVAEHATSHPARDIAAPSAGPGFAPDRSVIEIRGRCRDCGATAPNH